MSLLDDKLNQMLKLEFRAGHDEQQAVENIREIFGFHAIDSSTIRHEFNRFEAEKVGQFKDYADYHNSMVDLFPRGSSKIISGSMLSQVKERWLFCNMVTENGHIGFSIKDEQFFVVDLFHGEFQSIPIPGFSIWSKIKFVDGERFLVLQGLKLALFKFDLKTMTLELLNSLEINARLQDATLILDQLDGCKFIIYRVDTGRYSTGRVETTQIVLHDALNLGTDRLHFIKLVGNELYGLKKINSVWHFCKVDLLTTMFESIEISTVVANGEKFVVSDWNMYAWSGYRLYALKKMSNGIIKVIALDTEARIWSSTGIELMNEPRAIFVDLDEILTVIAKGLKESTVIFRVPLKKPDTLKNLAWFAWTRRSKMTDMNGYKLRIDKLSYNCDLRSEFPDVEQDDS